MGEKEKQGTLEDLLSYIEPEEEVDEKFNKLPEREKKKQQDLNKLNQVKPSS